MTKEQAEQGFVKLFGISTDRVERSTPVLEEVRRSGCHWACSYPKSKRPRSVKDGALIFMGRMVEEPNDILIYGRAIGMQHQPGRDEATAAEIALRPWKEGWSNYIRVRHAEFLAGTLSNGISLNRLMDALKSDAFASTQRNATQGSGNINPRWAYRQQAAVELSAQALVWLNERLDAAFVRHGRIGLAELKQLDWPAGPL